MIDPNYQGYKNKRHRMSFIATENFIKQVCVSIIYDAIFKIYSLSIKNNTIIRIRFAVPTI